MKRLIVALLAFSVAVVMAAPEDKTISTNTAKRIDRSKLTPEENLKRRMESRQRRFNRGGGRVVRPNSQHGKVAIVNCQKRALSKWLTTIADYYRFESKLNIVELSGTFELRDPKLQGDVTLFVVDDINLPSILAAPDNRWTMVNIAPLASGRGEKTAFFEARVKKQLSRGFAILCGATDSQFPGALTSGFSKVDDLDIQTDYQMPVDVLSRFRTYLKPLGVSPASYTTYEQACEEGWALTPTNNVQKAIWDKVHAVPKNPMKIEFDPKKGR